MTKEEDLGAWKAEAIVIAGMRNISIPYTIGFGTGGS